MAPRKVIYEQLDEIGHMFKTFTAGLQAALQTSAEDALTSILQDQHNRLEAQSQLAIYMEKTFNDDDLCEEYREIIGDHVFDVYDDDNQIQNLNNEFDAHKAEYLELTPVERINIFTKINNGDNNVYLGHEKQYMGDAFWGKDMLSYQDMVKLENVDTKDNDDFTSLANLHQHIKSTRPVHDRWELLRSEEHLHYKFDGDPIFYFSDGTLDNDVYIYELWAKSYEVASNIWHKSVKRNFLRAKEVAIPGMVAHVHLLEFTSFYRSFLRSNDVTLHQLFSCDFTSYVFATLIMFQMRGLMFLLAVALITNLLEVTQRWELRPNRFLLSLDFLNHSPWEVEQAIKFVLIYCFVCGPSLAREEAYTLSNIHEHLLYSWYMEIDKSGCDNLMLLCSFSILCRDLHCTSVAVLTTLTKLCKILATRYHRGSLCQPTVFAFLLQQLGLEALLGIFDDLHICKVTGEARIWILPPPVTDDSSDRNKEDTVEVDFHKGQHEMTELAVMEWIHESLSFRSRHVQFGVQILLGVFGDEFCCGALLTVPISHHYQVCDIFIQRCYIDKEKCKFSLEWKWLVGSVAIYVGFCMDLLDVKIGDKYYYTSLGTFSKHLVFQFDIFLEYLLAGNEKPQVFWPPWTCKACVDFTFSPTVIPLVVRLCSMLVPIIINTKVMQFAKVLVAYMAFDTFEPLRLLALLFIRSKAVWPLSPTFTSESFVSVHTFSLQVRVCYEVLKRGIEVVLCTKCGSNYTSTIPMERTDVACASSKWVICLIFHHVLRFVHGAVVFGSPSGIQCSLFLWEILKDADEFIDTRSKRPTVLVAVTVIHVQMCLVQPACLLCCFLQDLISLMDYDFSLDDVINVPTYSNHTSSYLSTRGQFLQEEYLFSCALWKRKKNFSTIYNDAHVFSREATINNGDLQLVQVKQSICVAYHVRRFMFHRGNRMLFVIMERMFSFVRPSWSSLALGSVYSTIHLLPFVSSLHEIHHGVLNTEFDVACLALIAAGSELMVVVESSTLVHVHSLTFQTARHENSSFCAFSAFMLQCDCFNDDVYGLILRGPLVFGVSPNFTRDSVQVMKSVSHSHVRGQILDHLKVSYDRYKAAAGWHRWDLLSYVGACVWTLLTKTCFVFGPYNHLEADMIDLLEVRGKIYTWKILVKANAKAYKVLFPSDARCSDVFNVTHLYSCISIADIEDSRANLFLPRVT